LSFVVASLAGRFRHVEITYDTFVTANRERSSSKKPMTASHTVVAST
jgi:hypothetical protein